MENKTKSFLIFFELILLSVNGLYLPEDICDGLSGVIVQHPDYCTHFVLCFMESPIIFICDQNNEVFHNGKCVPGNPEFCEVFTVAPPTTSTTSESASTTTTSTEPTTVRGLPDYLCKGIDIGYLPHPEDCSRFIFCMNEIPTVNSCPDRSIFFDGTCVEGDSSTCLPDRFCLGLDLITLPHPKNCSQFVFCMNERPINNSCPLDNPVFYNGSCTAGDPTTCEVYITTTKPSSTPLPDDFCDGTVNGFLPYQGDCSRFIFCINGNAIVNSCPSGNIFLNETCLPGDSTTCLPDSFCHELHLVTLPHPINCFQFVLCMNESPIINDCPPDNPVFHNESCTAGNPTTCEVFLSSTTTIEDPRTKPNTIISNEVTTDNTLTTKREILDDFCSDKLNLVYFSHPEDCSQFIFCMNGDAKVTSCPARHIFHGICVPGNSSTCLPDNYCVETHIGFMSHPRDCTKFVYCIGGSPFVHSCPNQTIFYNGTCVIGDVETCFPDDFCDGHDFEMLSHPRNCLKFVLCMNGHPVINSCPSQLPVFYDGSCVAGNPVTCEIPQCFIGGFNSIPHHTNCYQYFECLAGEITFRFCPEGLLFDSVTHQCTNPDLAVCAVG